MSEVYKKTRDLLERELEKLVASDNMTATNLELTYKIVDVIKDIDEICEKDSMLYGEDYSGRRGYNMRSSRAYGYPYMGNYMVEGSYTSGNNYGGGYSGNNYVGGYSNRNSGTSEMRSKLQKLLDEASTDHERMMIQSWMNDLMG